VDPQIVDNSGGAVAKNLWTTWVAFGWISTECSLTMVNMENDQLRIALDTLRVEEAEGAERIKELEMQMWAVNQRLEAIRTAITGLSAIVTEEPVGPAATEAGSNGEVAPAMSIDFTTSKTFTIDEPTVKRIPSARWLAEIVTDLNRVLTRDELFDAYKERHGFAPSWKKPRNVLGTALGRAVERGQIQNLGDDRYAPMNFEASHEGTPAAAEVGDA